MRNTIFSRIISAIPFVLITVVVAFIILMGYALIVETRDAVGVVNQGTHGSFVKEFQREEGGCIYFKNVFDGDEKYCGAYSVDKFAHE